MPFPRNRYERDFVFTYHYHRYPTVPYRWIYWEFGAPDVIIRWTYSLPYRTFMGTPDYDGYAGGECFCNLMSNNMDTGTTWRDEFGVRDKFGVTKIFDPRLLNKLIKFKKPSDIYEAYENYKKYDSHLMAVPNCLWDHVVRGVTISVFTLDGAEFPIVNWVDAHNESDFKSLLVTAYPDDFDDITTFKMFPYLDKEAKAMKAMIMAQSGGVFTFDDMKRVMIFRAFRKPDKNIRFDILFKNDDD